MKQRDLADRLGVHHTTVGYWERNKFFPEQYWAALNKLLHIELRPPGAPAPGPPETPLISPAMLAAIRKDVPPEDQQRVIDTLERLMRGEPQPPKGPAASADPSRERRSA